MEEEKDSRVLENVFPKYTILSSGMYINATRNYMEIHSYVRKKFGKKWYLIHVMTSEESSVHINCLNVAESTRRHIDNCYRALMFYKRAKVKLMQNGFYVPSEWLDKNQEDEETRLNIN